MLYHSRKIILDHIHSLNRAGNCTIDWRSAADTAIYKYGRNSDLLNY